MNEIFVFGSNLAGRHGKGAALTARKKYGAIYGQGVGLQGNSYGIPTKDEKIRTLRLIEIIPYIDSFISHVQQHQQDKYLIANIGCGLAGYTPEQIAPFFWQLMDYEKYNVEFQQEFKLILVDMLLNSKDEMTEIAPGMYTSFIKNHVRGEFYSLVRKWRENYTFMSFKKQPTLIGIV